MASPYLSPLLVLRSLRALHCWCFCLRFGLDLEPPTVCGIESRNEVLTVSTANFHVAIMKKKKEITRDYYWRGRRVKSGPLEPKKHSHLGNFYTRVTSKTELIQLRGLLLSLCPDMSYSCPCASSQRLTPTTQIVWAACLIEKSMCSSHFASHSDVGCPSSWPPSASFCPPLLTPLHRHLKCCRALT